MKTFITFAALALAGAATSVSAMTLDSNANARAIHQYAPTADLSQLSDREILVILNAINNGDSAGDVRQQVRALTTHVR